MWFSGVSATRRLARPKDGGCGTSLVGAIEAGLVRTAEDVLEALR